MVDVSIGHISADPVQGEVWKKEAVKLNRLTKNQKGAIAWEVDKSKGLVTGYKTEKEQGSSLIRDTAIEAHASWTRLNAKLNSLEDNISKYNNLVILLCKSAEEESATEIKINESIV